MLSGLVLDVIANVATGPLDFARRLTSFPFQLFGLVSAELAPNFLTLALDFFFHGNLPLDRYVFRTTSNQGTLSPRRLPPVPPVSRKRCATCFASSSWPERC